MIVDKSYKNATVGGIKIRAKRAITNLVSLIPKKLKRWLETKAAQKQIVIFRKLKKFQTLGDVIALKNERLLISFAKKLKQEF